jgi:hypothetical protein
VTVPLLGRSKPVISLARVLLPLPLAPTSPTAAPGAMVSDTSCSAVTGGSPRCRGG